MVFTVKFDDYKSKNCIPQMIAKIDCNHHLLFTNVATRKNLIFMQQQYLSDMLYVISGQFSEIISYEQYVINCHLPNSVASILSSISSNEVSNDAEFQDSRYFGQIAFKHRS